VLYQLSYTHHELPHMAARTRPEQCTGCRPRACYPFGSWVPYWLAISLEVALSGPGAGTKSAAR
jgi:hypothetical protein